MPNPEKPKEPEDDEPAESWLLEEEATSAETEPVLESETSPELPAPEPEVEQQTMEAKRDLLKKLLMQEQSLREIIFDIEAKKKKKEDVHLLEEEALRKEYKETADGLKSLAGEIAGADIEEEARKKHEQNKSDEEYKTKIENAAAIKAENEDFKTERINRLISPLFKEEDALTEKEKKYYEERGKLGLGQGKYSPAEAAGLLASGLIVDEIKSIKLPVWGKIKVPVPGEEERQFSSGAELEQYAIECLSHHIAEEAKKETDNYAVRAISLQMIKNVAETGNIEGEPASAEASAGGEEKTEKKPEISKESKILMQEKLDKEIRRLTEEFYDAEIKGKLKKHGEPIEIREKERTEFIIKRIRVDAKKNPEAAELKKELDDLVVLRSGLNQEKPLPEANYLALNYFWRKADEAKKLVSVDERKDYKKAFWLEDDKAEWEENSEIVRELANCVRGKDLTEEAKKELSEFLKSPEIVEQFEKEQKEYIEKEKQSRSAARIDSLLPPETASQINETGKLEIGKIILDKEEVIALVSSGYEAKDIMKAKPALFSDKIKIGNRSFSKNDLELKKSELNSLIERILGREFQEKWKVRVKRTFEESKIKDLFKKDKAKEILGEEFSVEKLLGKIRSNIEK